MHKQDWLQNKRTKGTKPEGIRGKKDGHKTGNTQKTDSKATIQCVHQNESTVNLTDRLVLRDFTLKQFKTSQKFKNPV